MAKKIKTEDEPSEMPLAGSDPTESANLLNLPDEVRKMILERSGTKSVPRLKEASNLFAMFDEDDRFWREVYRHEFGFKDRLVMVRTDEGFRVPRFIPASQDTSDEPNKWKKCCELLKKSVILVQDDDHKAKYVADTISAIDLDDTTNLNGFIVFVPEGDIDLPYRFFMNHYRPLVRTAENQTKMQVMFVGLGNSTIYLVGDIVPGLKLQNMYMANIRFDEIQLKLYSGRKHWACHLQQSYMKFYKCRFDDLIAVTNTHHHMMFEKCRMASKLYLLEQGHQARVTISKSIFANERTLIRGRSNFLQGQLRIEESTFYRGKLAIDLGTGFQFYVRATQFRDCGVHIYGHCRFCKVLCDKVIFESCDLNQFPIRHCPKGGTYFGIYWKEFIGNMLLTSSDLWHVFQEPVELSEEEDAAAEEEERDQVVEDNGEAVPEDDEEEIDLELEEAEFVVESDPEEDENQSEEATDWYELDPMDFQLRDEVDEDNDAELEDEDEDNDGEREDEDEDNDGEREDEDEDNDGELEDEDEDNDGEREDEDDFDDDDDDEDYDDEDSDSEAENQDDVEQYRHVEEDDDVEKDDKPKKVDKSTMTE